MHVTLWQLAPSLEAMPGQGTAKRGLATGIPREASQRQSRLFVTCSYVVNGPVVLGPRSPDQEMLHTQSWLVAQKGVSCSPGEAPEVGSTLVSDTQMSGRIGDGPGLGAPGQPPEPSPALHCPDSHLGSASPGRPCWPKPLSQAWHWKPSGCWTSRGCSGHPTISSPVS